MSILESAGWTIEQGERRGDLYEKLITAVHFGFSSKLHIDKMQGTTRSGEIRHLKVIVHPDCYRTDLENAKRGIRPAINRLTKKNRHSHSGFQSFPRFEGNHEPCGMAYHVRDEAALRELLLGLVRA